MFFNSDEGKSAKRDGLYARVVNGVVELVFFVQNGYLLETAAKDTDLKGNVKEVSDTTPGKNAGRYKNSSKSGCVIAMQGIVATRSVNSDSKKDYRLSSNESLLDLSFFSKGNKCTGCTEQHIDGDIVNNIGLILESDGVNKNASKVKNCKNRKDSKGLTNSKDRKVLAVMIIATEDPCESCSEHYINYSFLKRWKFNEYFGVKEDEIDKFLDKIWFITCKNKLIGMNCNDYWKGTNYYAYNFKFLSKLSSGLNADNVREYQGRVDGLIRVSTDSDDIKNGKWVNLFTNYNEKGVTFFEHIFKSNYEGDVTELKSLLSKKSTFEIVEKRSDNSICFGKG